MSSIKTDILVIGAGPAGLMAALSAANEGADVALLERDPFLGGQLVKQTHMFFGSERQFASERGFKIGKILANRVIESEKIQVYTNTTALAYYEDDVVLAEKNDKLYRFKPSKVIVSTGAEEKTLAFPNWDLPGVYGAGAVQTLMNVYGVKPGNKVAMVGAGNIGTIVSYQLMQAGVNVEAIIEAAPKIGSYLVHASKVRRLGVPIYTSHTVKEAHGKDYLEGITMVALDDKWSQISGTEQYLDVDVLCISVGLSPLTKLLFQAGCKMEYVKELGGFTPTRTETFETSVKGLYVAGDVAGIEEACSAMMEGELAGLYAAESLGYRTSDFWLKIKNTREELSNLRRGIVGEHILGGLNKLNQLSKMKGVV